MSKRMDLRVLKTRKLIRDSFIQLIDEKGFENITINDISGRAQINRSTFYLHYTDKYELLDKTVDEAIEKLLANFEYDSFTQRIHTILRTIADDALFYKTMFGDSGMPDIRKKTVNILKQKLRQHFHEQTLIPKELFIELLSSIHMGAITWWLNNDMTYSPAYMAEQLIKMLTMGPAKVAGLDSAENHTRHMTH